MSDQITTDRQSPVPPGAGLPTGGRPGDGQQTGPRSGDDLLDAAAAGLGVTRAESEDLVEYWLANGELPDDDKTTPVTVKLGDSGRKFRCEIKKITWDEWQDGLERATDKSGSTDTYIWSSWNVARALVVPKLGPTVIKLQQENADRAPEHAAELLQRMFRKQSGALLELSAKVLDISKLGRDSDSVEDLNEHAEREVNAAKN